MNGDGRRECGSSIKMLETVRNITTRGRRGDRAAEPENPCPIRHSVIDISGRQAGPVWVRRLILELNGVSRNNAVGQPDIERLPVRGEKLQIGYGGNGIELE